jgi:saccharopine dehydrogenase-like NADP-dependent oxidoreductase
MRVIVFGAGKVGATIIDMLAASGLYAVTAADRDPAVLARVPARIRTELVDVADEGAVRAAIAGHDTAVSACPFFVNPTIAAAARAARAHYFDLTEDVETTAAVRAIAEGAPTAFVPQCGLAPGFVGIVAHALAQRFERLRSLRLRVGALPRYPSNALKYNLTWSTDGLINEYCNPCEAIEGGRRVPLQPLEGLERFALDGVEYEAFNTSGGLGSLCETLAGRVESLNYRTIRYPGHRDIMRLLLEDLRLKDRRELLKDVLENAVPVTAQDVVLIVVAASGWTASGRLVEETYARRVFGDERAGGASAIQRTTASGLCAMVDLLRRGRLPSSGFVPQERARLDEFLESPFAAVYGGGEEAIVLQAA